MPKIKKKTKNMITLAPLLYLYWVTAGGAQEANKSHHNLYHCFNL